MQKGKRRIYKSRVIAVHYIVINVNVFYINVGLCMHTARFTPLLHHTLYEGNHPLHMDADIVVIKTPSK